MAGNPRLLVSFSCALLTAPLGVASGQTGGREAARVEFFEKKIRPVLANNCYNCHSANTNAKGGLRVDDRNGLLQGGGRGPAVVPGQPDKSLLLQAVRHTHKKLKMPPKKPLSEEQLADLATWIRDGAAWPAVEVPASVGRPSAKYARLRKQHWAWQPLRDARVPAVRDGSWPRSDIDRFLLARLEGRGLNPVRDADRTTLIRRVTFDLTGLPPTPAETDAFANDPSPAAFEKVVDRLLASPAFGERWGRHWLDVARYGESTGSSRNVPYPHAWRYRDYVLDAFNADMPYDQFLREQLAGDLLPAGSQRDRDRQRIATGFLALGVRDVNQRFKVRFIMDNIDEQIDTVSRSVLALTVSCARCHNHKFDPIPTTDYYALAGIFRSTDLCAGVRNKMGGGGLDYYDTALLLPLGSTKPRDPTADPALAEQVARATAALAKARKEFQALAGTPKGKAKGPDGKPMQMVARLKMVRLQQDLLALTDPAAHGPVALGVRDARTVADTEIRVRGEAEQLGPVVPRGFLSALDVPDAPKVNPTQSGRLELAHWLTSPKNPLTPRVMANRIWQRLFGEGLVRSVDNFGVTGDEPSHPELLDYLAARFVEGGWSVKKLVQALVLSRAYQLGSEAPAAHLAADPANRLLWRHAPRRLDAEEIRDAMLAAAGTLDPARPRGSPAQGLAVMELRNDGPEARRLEGEALASRHRSVYLPLLRGLTPRALEVFDFAEQGMVTGSRDATTVAPQALYLLNDPFVQRQALKLAERLLQEADLGDAGRIDLAYRLAVGRAATAGEVERAKGYLADYETAARNERPSSLSDPRTAAWASFCQALLASAEFRYLR
jgi:cytochrome c553